MNNIQSSPSFTSTIIPPKAAKSFGKFVDELDRYFEVKGLNGSAEKMRSQINLGQTAIGFSKDGIVVVGKDKSADNFIYRTLKGINKDVEFINDAPEIKVDGPVFDFTV